LPDKTILAYGAYGDLMYLAKFSQQGQLLNENFYYPGGFTDRTSGSCNIINVKIIDGYIYAVGGSHNMFKALNTYTDLGTLLKTDLDGKPIWAKQFGNYYGYNILDQIYQTSNSRLLLAGLGVDSTQMPLHGVSWYVMIQVYPNPTNGELTIKNPLQLAINQIQFYDGNGTLCHTQLFDEPNAQFNIDVTYLKQGLYYLKINTPRGIIVKKIVKD
jgi:hypothetical protein